MPNYLSSFFSQVNINLKYAKRVVDKMSERKRERTNRKLSLRLKYSTFNPFISICSFAQSHQITGKGVAFLPNAYPFLSKLTSKTVNFWDWIMNIKFISMLYLIHNHMENFYKRKHISTSTKSIHHNTNVLFQASTLIYISCFMTWHKEPKRLCSHIL